VVGLVAVTLLLAVVALVAVPTAALGVPAQSVDSAYGPDPVPPEEVSAVCSVSPTSAAAGDSVVGTLQNGAANADVTVTFDGTFVSSGTTDDQGNATIAFTVPSGGEAGTHQVDFSAPGFSCAIDITQVLGATTARSPSKSSGPLARTGIQIALLLAIALVLVLVGSQLVRRARRHRRRIEAAERRSALLRS
jgi:hypothetical protein